MKVRVIKVGRPMHFRTNDGRIACGLVNSTASAAYDGRYVDCLSCRRTKKWQIYAGPKKSTP